MVHLLKTFPPRVGVQERLQRMVAGDPVEAQDDALDKERGYSGLHDRKGGHDEAGGKVRAAHSKFICIQIRSRSTHDCLLRCQYVAMRAVADIAALPPSRSCLPVDTSGPLKGGL